MLRTLLVLTLFLFIVQKGSTQELMVFPGAFSYKYYQDSNQITKSEFKNLMSQDAEAIAYWNKRNKNLVITGVSYAVYIGTSTWALTTDSDAIVPGLISLGSLATGIVFAFIARNNMHKAILKYNDNLECISLDLKPTNNGLGLVLSF